MSENNGARNATQTQGRHLVLPAGGSRAILGGAGAVIALDQALCAFDEVQLRARSRDWESIGGVSGGSMPAALYAGGYSAKETLQMAMDIDFSSMLTRHGSIVQILYAYFMQKRSERTRPRHGVLTAEKLGVLMNRKLPHWPDRFWTIAAVGDHYVIFDKHGAREVLRDGTVKVLADAPVPVGLAIMATVAIPGIISAVPYKGRYLFDGALTEHGSCPVDVAALHYAATHPTTFAVDVGDDGGKMAKRVVRLWKLLCGNNCIPGWQDKELTEEHGMVVIKPSLTQFRSLQFDLTRDQKWMAVMTAYVSTVEALKRANLITGEKLAEMESICAAYADIETLGRESEGLIAMLAEDLLSKHGLW